MDASILYAGVAFGVVGMGYIAHGRKQRNAISVIAGISLCGMPYLVTNLAILIPIGLLLMAVPFFIRI